MLFLMSCWSEGDELPSQHLPTHRRDKDVCQSVTARSPSPNPRAQGGIVSGCVNGEHEGCVVSDMWREVGEKHQLLSSFTCSPLAWNSSNYKCPETDPEHGGNRGPAIERDMKLPVQTRDAGAQQGSVWLRNLGLLCRNTYSICCPHPPFQKINEKWVPLNIPEACEPWEDASGQTDV